MRGKKKGGTLAENKNKKQSVEQTLIQTLPPEDLLALFQGTPPSEENATPARKFKKSITLYRWRPKIYFASSSYS